MLIIFAKIASSNLNICATLGHKNGYILFSHEAVYCIGYVSISSISETMHIPAQICFRLADIEFATSKHSMINITIKI